MDKRGEILIENLKETFKSIDKLLLLGLTASLTLAVIAVTDRHLVGTQTVPGINITAPTPITAELALGAYVVSGALAFYYFIGRMRIIKKLAEMDSELIEALLTYPSLVSRIGAPQLVAIWLIAGPGMFAVFYFLRTSQILRSATLFSAIIGLPYILMFLFAFAASVQEQRYSTVQGKDA